MHDDILWVKGEGPAPNQQLPAHKYKKTGFQGWFVFWRAAVWRETDPTGCVESCVKEWSQSRCVFLFTCRLIGVERGAT